MELDPGIVLASRVLGTLVFGTAAVGKLRHSEEFIAVVANYQVLAQPLVRVAAWSIVILELLVAGSLGTGLVLRLGAAGAGTLLLIFAAAMTLNLARGRSQIDCGCFQSAQRHPLGVALIVRNLALLALMLPLAAAPPAASPALLQYLDGIGAGIVLFTLWHVLEQLLALRGSALRLSKRVR